MCVKAIWTTCFCETKRVSADSRKQCIFATSNTAVEMIEMFETEGTTVFYGFLC